MSPRVRCGWEMKRLPTWFPTDFPTALSPDVAACPRMSPDVPWGWESQKARTFPTRARGNPVPRQPTAGDEFVVGGTGGSPVVPVLGNWTLPNQQEGNDLRAPRIALL